MISPATNAPIIPATPNEFAKKVIELTGINSNIENKPLPEDDPVKRKPDISKAKELLNWEPKVRLDEGLRKTIDWFASIKK